MVPLRNGRFLAQLATSEDDKAAALTLRARCFRSGLPDLDRFDPHCQHIVILDTEARSILATCRLLELRDGSVIDQSYSAQFYGLHPFTSLAGPLVEIGRFCVDPAFDGDADVLRMVWAALTTYVDEIGAEYLFGCSSFPGTDPTPYLGAFARLGVRHQAPEALRPTVKAPEILRFEGLSTGPVTMPALLRIYLQMGAWVSDHAVVDRDLGTHHVFTALEVKAVPSLWVKRLRGLSGRGRCLQ